MKNLKKVLVVILTIGSILPILSQEKNINELNYWQITPRVGYDFPMYDENFKYIGYEGGITTGLSVNKFWSHFGLQFDFDYIKNSPKTENILNPLYVNAGAGFPIVGDLNVWKNKINRMYLGLGPAYKYQSPSNRFTFDASFTAGIGNVDGGEILAFATLPPPPASPPNSMPITYHSGFDNKWVFSIQPGVKFNYYFNQSKTFGVHAGMYYLRHFGVNESTNNNLLQKYSNDYLGGTLPSGFTFYYYEGNTQTLDGVDGVTYYDGEGFTRGNDPDLGTQEFDGGREKIDVASFGVFAGLSFRIFPNKKEKCGDGLVFCEKHNGCHTPPACCTANCPKPSCNLSITAKDKFTGKVLPNTDVVLVNGSGQSVKTGTSNSYGVVIFSEVPKGNYTIKGKLHDVDLQETMVTEAELAACEAQNASGGATGVVEKEILYTDERFILQGTVIECNSTQKIQGVNVVLKNKNQAQQKNTLSDANGLFIFHVNQASQYTLKGDKDGYFSNEVEITTNEYDRNKTLFINFEMCVDPCGKAIKLDNIQFDLDKWNIKPVAVPDLYYIVKLMTDNPNIKVEMSSHTDSRGSDVYNKTLSQKRAESTVDWLVSHGVNRSRLVSRGAGESELLNRCSDGVTCSEAEHAINRRTEFKVICD